MKIGLDIMGGDYAPAEAINGVCSYLKEHNDTDVHLVLIGNAELVAAYMPLIEAFSSRYTFVEATEVIGMDEHPTKALKEKQQSSIAIGFAMLMRGKIDAFISAGNTGAMLVGAMYTVKAIEGVLRPTIASPIPQMDGTYNLMLDVGINADCKPEHLLQFAQLGTLYSKHILGVENPKVGLLNIGEEEGKGNILAQATYPLLKELEGINFIGNVEGRDLFYNKAQVIVCEGFVGNVVLKLAESFYDIFKVQKGVNDPLLDNFNFETYGGTPILGINSPVIIGHGISHGEAFKNMIKVATKLVSVNLTEIFKQNFKPHSELKPAE